MCCLMGGGKNAVNTKSLILGALFSALIAAGAFIKIPVPVIPFTLQFLFTTLAGLLLGARAGAMSVGVYIAIGLLGVPVFALGGGLGYIFQPTFGYLIGFCAGTYVTGLIAEKSRDVSFRKLLAASFAGMAVVYIFGVSYYYFIANYYLNSPIAAWTLILYGFVLAAPGDIIICFASAYLAGRLIPIIRAGVI